MRAAVLLDLPGRSARTSRIDTWLREVYADAGGRSTGMALVAVGSLGRGEVAPASDLDLLLLHAGGSAGDVPDRLWYPVWDSGIRLDHSVRTPREARSLAQVDLKVVLGLCEARTVAGDAALVESLREVVLADWRGQPARLADLATMVDERRESRGVLGHLLEPDLKESYGGLRDLTVLRAIAASWVVDVPHGPMMARAREVLLDCRDALHHQTRRSSDVLRREEQGRLAEGSGYDSAESLLREVLAAGRTIAHASDQAWHRVERSRHGRPRGMGRSRMRSRAAGADRTPLVEGVVVQEGEAVLSLDARPEADPVLLLRAAAAAAQADLRLSEHAVDRLSRSGALPDPWPSAARDALVSLLGAGASLIPIWEALDQAGLISRLIPEWEAVRSLPQGSPVHRFTVDRHLVETVAAAAQQARQVTRPDLLLVGALLHDIGKGCDGDHSEIGARIAADIVNRMGFAAADQRIITALVRHHLVLPETAVRRDLSDPGTIAMVAAAVESVEVLELLAALAVADASATGPAAWSAWKAGLIADLVGRTRQVLGDPAPHEAPGEPTQFDTDEAAQLWGDESADPMVRQLPDVDGWRLEVIGPDRVGFLADIAGVMSLHRLEIRSADVLSWRVEPNPAGDEAGPRRVRLEVRARPLYGDPPGVDRLREDLRRVADGSLDLQRALEARASAYPQRVAGAPPVVMVDETGSSRATIIEVRAHDAPGLLQRLLRAIADHGAAVIAARMSTLGSEAVDAFYVVDAHGRPVRGSDLTGVSRALASAALGGGRRDG